MAVVRNIIVRVGADITALQRALRRSQSALQKTGKKITNIGKGLTMGITAPLTGLGALTVKTSMDFEKSMSEVAAVTGATGKSFDDLKSKAKEMGAKTSKTASEAAEALKYMGLAGWNVKTSMEALEPVLRLSEAGNLDLARTSDLVTDSMSALGLSVEQLPKYLDQVAQTSRKSNTNIDMLMQAMIAAGGTFKNLNTPLEEANALLGILANRGKKGSEAGNAMNSILINLTSGAGQAGTAMEKLNFSAFDAQGKFKGVSNVLIELRQRLSKYNEEQRNTFLAMIGGKTQIDTLNALLDGIGKEFVDLKADVKNSNNALNDMAKTMQNNLSGQITRIKSALEGVAIQIGNILLPYVKSFADILQKLISRFAKLDGGIKKIIVFFAVFAGAIGPLTLIVGGLITVLGSVAGIVTTIGGVITTVGLPVILGLAAGFAVLTVQVGIAVGTFVYLTKQLGFLKDGFEVIRAFISGDINKIFEMLTNRLGWTEEAAKKLTEKLESVRSKSRQIWHVIKNNLEPFLKSLSDSFLNLGKSTNISKSFFSKFIKFVVDKLDKLTKYFYNLFDSFGLIPLSVKYAKDKTAYEFMKLNAIVDKNLYELLSLQKKWGTDYLKENKKIYDNKLSDVKTSLNNELKFIETKLKEKKNKEIAMVSKIFKESSALSEITEQEKLKKLKKSYIEEEKELKEKNNKIKTILDAAAKEKRSLTANEQSEIRILRESFENQAVATITDSKDKQKVILENAKRLAIQVSKEEAMTTIAEANKQYDELVSKAKQTRDDKVKEIIKMRDDIGIITYEESQRMIKEADAEYKGIVDKAKSTKDETIQLASEKSLGIITEQEKETRDTNKEAEKIKGVLKEIWEDIKKEIPKLAKEAGAAIGKALIAGMLKGFKDNAKILKDGSKLIADGVIGVVAGAFGIQSPSKVFQNIGKNLIEGLNKGIKDNTKKSKKEIEKLANEINNSLKNKIRNLKNKTDNIMGQLDLFSHVENKRMRGNYLLKSLKSQVNAMEDYTRYMDKFKKQVGGESLIYKKFRDLGVGSLNELKSIVKMDNARILEYMNLYNQKHSLASEMATQSFVNELGAGKRLDSLVVNITGNRIITDDIDELTDEIVRNLKVKGGIY